MSSRRRSSIGLSLAVVCAVLIIVPFLARLAMLGTRTFDPDEFQHLHAAWMLHAGLVPFRDFFEHHMPGIQFMLAPLMRHFDVGASADATIRFMVAARIVMAAFAGTALLLTGVLAWQRSDVRGAAIATALLGTSIVFLGRTLEIRPDTPGLACWLAALAALACALDEERTSGATAWWAASGIAFGSALAYNQKLLLAAPGLAIWMAVYTIDRNGRRIDRSRLAHLALFAGGTAAPLVAMAAWFWWHGAFGAFIVGSIVANLGWPREVSARSTLAWLALRDPIVSALMLGGFVRDGLLIMRRPWVADVRLACWLAAMSLLALLFVTPTPFPQYLLTVLPLGAIAAADLVIAMVALAAPSVGSPVVDMRATLTGAFVAAVTLVVTLTIARPVYLHPAMYPLLGMVALGAAAVLGARAQADLAAAVLLVAASMYPFQQIRWMQGLSNAEQLRAIRYLHETTAPGEAVMDGFTGLSWFRPQPSYYGFLHPGVRAFLTPAQTASIIEALDGRGTRPRAVILDANLRALSPEIEPLVRRAYHPGTVVDIWLRDDLPRAALP